MGLTFKTLVLCWIQPGGAYFPHAFHKQQYLVGFTSKYYIFTYIIYYILRYMYFITYWYYLKIYVNNYNIVYTKSICAAYGCHLANKTKSLGGYWIRAAHCKPGCKDCTSHWDIMHYTNTSCITWNVETSPGVPIILHDTPTLSTHIKKMRSIFFISRRARGWQCCLSVMYNDLSRRGGIHMRHTQPGCVLQPNVSSILDL